MKSSREYFADAENDFLAYGYAPGLSKLAEVTALCEIATALHEIARTLDTIVHPVMVTTTPANFRTFDQEVVNE